MKLDKMHVARQQLYCAIELFVSDKNYISAITLAGAAEEIFGRIAKKSAKKTQSTSCSEVKENSETQEHQRKLPTTQISFEMH